MEPEVLGQTRNTYHLTPTTDKLRTATADILPTSNHMTGSNAPYLSKRATSTQLISDIQGPPPATGSYHLPKPTIA